MWRNYLKIAIRSLLKNKLSTFINISGLAIGLAACLLAMGFIQQEYAFDKFHPDYDHIFRITSRFKSFELGSTPLPMGPAIDDFYGEITGTTRFTEQEIVVHKQTEYFLERGLSVDPSFLSVFGFPLLKGLPDAVLSKADGIVLSEEMARKYFGYADPIGQTLEIRLNGQDKLFQVTGIAQIPPEESSIRFDFLMRLEPFFSASGELENGWMNYSVSTVVKVTDPLAIPDIKARIPEFVNKYMGDAITADGSNPEDIGFDFQALADYHFYGGGSANGMTGSADPSYIRIFSGLALLILLVACFNFMNLATAQSSGRIREIGIRKVIGAARRQLAVQFLAEALLMSFLALLLSTIVVELVAPLLEGLLGVGLKLQYLSDWVIPVFFVGITLISGLIAGSYPALLLSGIRIVDTFRNRFRLGGNNLITKGSIVFQFVLSTGLIAATLIMWRQQSFISHYNLGFDRDQVVVVPTQTKRSETGEGSRIVETMKRELDGRSGIVNISGVSNSFTRGSSASLIVREDQSRTILYLLRADYNYLATMGMELAEGRNFNSGFGQDTINSIIVNETFLKAFDVKDPLNVPFEKAVAGIEKPQIIGIVKDFHFQGLQNKVEPMAIYMQNGGNVGYMLVKIKPDNVAGTIALIQDSWKKAGIRQPFEFHFLDDDIQRQYDAENKWSSAVTWAALLALVIGCLGLFGLSALTIYRRTREIGIRKAMGAEITNIIGLLSVGYLKLIGLSVLIAVPFVLYGMNKWLQTFAYRIDMEWWIFAVAGLIALGIAFITVSVQSLKAALANPVNSLKNE